ncbi:MAG: methyl-accepting chemotaxis protein [Phycisphaerales bacterium]
MKNLSIGVKMGILVAVLLATALTIAAVGVTQLNRLKNEFDNLVETTSRAMMLASEARSELFMAVRAEKNAILVPEKAAAAESAEVARQHLGRVKELRGDLVKLVGANQATTEATALADLDRGLDDFEKNQKELLRLAVIKSNVDGGNLLYGDLYRRVLDAEEFVDGLAESAREGGAAATPAAAAEQKAKVNAGQQMLGRIYDLLFHAALHLNSASEKEMAELDAKIRQGIAAIQESSRRMSAMLNEAERGRGVSVLASIESIKPEMLRIQDLSHANTDVNARQLTTTKAVEATNRCNAALSSLLAALTERLGDDKKDVAASVAFGRTIVVAAGAIGALISLALAFVTIRSVTRPVERGVKVLEAIAAGDLTRRMNLDQRDEMGRLAAASDRMGDKLLEVVTQTRALADRLGESDGELSGVSHDLLSQSQEMATQAESVAAATEQMSSNISGMASAAEEMSVNVSSISSASEEVSVNVASVSASAAQTSRNVGVVAKSIGEITSSLKGVAQDAREGSQMTQQARDMAATANQAMRQLDQAASEINKVTEVIKSIALQTNLLALNATIGRRARPGKDSPSSRRSGKGSPTRAVSRPRRSRAKIEGVQASTRDAVKVIEALPSSSTSSNVSAARGSPTPWSACRRLQTRSRRRSPAPTAASAEDVLVLDRRGRPGRTDVSGNTAEVSKAATDVSRNASRRRRPRVVHIAQHPRRERRPRAQEQRRRSRSTRPRSG